MNRVTNGRHVPMSDSEFSIKQARKAAFMRGWMDAARVLRKNPPVEYTHEYELGYEDGQEMRRRASYKSGMVAMNKLRKEREATNETTRRQVQL